MGYHFSFHGMQLVKVLVIELRQINSHFVYHFEILFN